jgi:regulator of sigma E protease
METFIIRAFQLILSLSILVFFHELGHFGFARLFKVRVEKFYLFFNPKFSLIRAKKINGKWEIKYFSKNIPANEREKMDADGNLVQTKKGKPVYEPIPLDELNEGDWRKYPETTEWGIGWLPLGGYCKISGMIDESMDTTILNQEAQPWEYRSRSVWQRLPIIIGGVLVNFVMAMLIFSAILFTWGKEELPLQNAKYGLHFSPTLLKHGFKNGDQIEKIEGIAIDDRSDLIQQILIDGKQHVSIIRNNQRLSITLPKDLSQKLLAAEEKDLISIAYPFVINEVSDGTPAKSAKFQKGDQVISINGISTPFFQDISLSLDSNKNKLIQVGFVRSGHLLNAKVQMTETGKLGVQVKSPMEYFKTRHIAYSFSESISAGCSLGWETLVSYIKQFKLVFTPEGSKRLGGFGSIGTMFPTQWDWQMFWSMTALLSLILAFMNILPIPALDGGHVLFLLYEMITGKKPSDKFLEYAQTVGMALLFALLIYSNGNDLFKAIFK